MLPHIKEIYVDFLSAPPPQLPILSSTILSATLQNKKISVQEHEERCPIGLLSTYRHINYCSTLMDGCSDLLTERLYYFQKRAVGLTHYTVDIKVTVLTFVRCSS